MPATVATAKAVAFVLILASAALIADQQGSPSPSNGRMDCASVKQLQLPDVRITAAAMTATWSEHQGRALSGGGCRRTRDPFPAAAAYEWNQRFAMGGGGGFVGSIDNQAATTVNAGYATVGTDTGHQALPFSAAWALNDLERQVNFGHLAVHRVAEVAKAIIAAYYEAPARAFVFPRLLERRPPGDDGSAALSRRLRRHRRRRAGARLRRYRGAVHARQRACCIPTRKNSAESPLHARAAEARRKQVVAACDAQRRRERRRHRRSAHAASSDVELPTCGDRADGCLTRRRRRLKGDLRADQEAAGEIYAAQPIGGEVRGGRLATWITGPNELVYKLAKAPSLRFAFGTEMFKYFVFNDPSWDYTRYDLSTWKKDTRSRPTFLNATNPNLDAFKARGRKVILWHGWSDPALTALGQHQVLRAGRGARPERCANTFACS